jgi:hypothetical protein
MPVFFTCPAALAGWELLVADLRANWLRDVHPSEGMRWRRGKVTLCGG